MNRSPLAFVAVLTLTAWTAPTLYAQSGHSYSGVHEHLDVIGLAGSNGFLFSNPIAGAGDVNGDGVEDFLIGVPEARGGMGKTTLYSGTRGDSWPYYVELWSETGSRGYGGSSPDGFGTGLCALGDINSDGYDDFAVSSGNGHYVMVYLGPTCTLLKVLVTHSENASNDYGSAMTAVDLDGDNINELVVGDPNWESNGPTEKGMIHVYQFIPLTTLSSMVSGGGEEPTTTIVSITRFVNPIAPGELSTPDMRVTLVAELAGLNENWFGASLAGVTTGVGANYLLVGAPRMETSLTGPLAGGEVFLYRDDPNTVPFDLEEILTIQDTFSNTEPGKFGIAVASVGDIRGNDGVDEFIVGAPATDLAQIDAGYAKVFDVDGNVILTLNGTVADEGLGATLAALGDVDGDQIADFVIGAPGVSAGPGYVALYSGADGSVIDTVQGIEPSVHFGRSVATSGDVDGDGSRDLIIARNSNVPSASSVHVYRPLHSLPYRITVDAVGTDTNFAPIHGTNHGPGHKTKWTKQIGLDPPYLKNRTQDLSAQFAATHIPNTRITSEGVGDLNYLWLLDQGILDDMSRDYNVSNAEIENLANYDFWQMDVRMDIQEALPGMDTIWRVGHDKGDIPGSLDWYPGFNEVPNNIDGVAKVAAQILKHYNKGWGGRAIPTTPIRLVELWNEPFLNFWTGTGTEFGELHVAMLKALDENFDSDADGIADNMTMMTPIAPGDPEGFTTEFLDVLEANWDPQNPHKIRLDGVVQHWYMNSPHQFLRHFEGLDTFYKEIGESHHALKQGENEAVVYPELWVTEWNRTIEQYAYTYASMPFLMNAFYYMNGLYHGDFKRTDGDDFSISFAGANFFSAKDALWGEYVNRQSNLVEVLRDHAGLAWEVYGTSLFEEAPERLHVEGSFYEPQMEGGALNPIKDFTVMAGRSNTQNRVVVVVSSLQAADMDDHPDSRDAMQRLPYVLTIPNLEFTPVTITRLVQETDTINFALGQQAQLVAIPEFGSGVLPYSAWQLTVNGSSVSLNVADMIQNSYEVIIIEG